MDQYTVPVYMMDYRYDRRVLFYPVVTQRRIFDQKTGKVKYTPCTPKLLQVVYLAIPVLNIKDFFPDFAFAPGDYTYIHGQITFTLMDTPLPTCNPLSPIKEPLLWEKQVLGIDIDSEYRDLKAYREAQVQSPLWDDYRGQDE